MRGQIKVALISVNMLPLRGKLLASSHLTNVRRHIVAQCTMLTEGGSTLYCSQMFSSTSNVGDTDPFAKLMAQLKGVDTAAKSRGSSSQKSIKGTQSVPPALQAQEEAAASSVVAAKEAKQAESSTNVSATTLSPATVSSSVNSNGVPSNQAGQVPPSSKIPDVREETSTQQEPLKTAKAQQTSEQQRVRSTSNSDAASLLCGVAAHPPLTTSEMIQEGAPQHFVAEAESDSIHRPLLTTTGCVAISDIIGRVSSPPESYEDPSGSNGTFTSFTVEYTVPFSHITPVKCSLEVRAYGPVLSQYAANELVLDDIVHVTGHLLPTEQGMTVVALPWGGNISVVLTPNVADNSSNSQSSS